MLNYLVIFSSISLQFSQAPQQFSRHLPWYYTFQVKYNGTFDITIIKPIQVKTNDNKHGQRRSHLLFVHLIRFFSDVFGNDSLHVSNVVLAVPTFASYSTAKTKSSMQTPPLVPFIQEKLLALKEDQQENRRLCGRSYIKDDLEYICVN